LDCLNKKVIDDSILLSTGVRLFIVFIIFIAFSVVETSGIFSGGWSGKVRLLSRWPTLDWVVRHGIIERVFGKRVDDFSTADNSFLCCVAP
jgi:hypothetical protein